MEIGIPLILIGAAIIAYAIISQRRERAASEPESAAQAEAAVADVNVDRPRPEVADFHVAGEEARVTFAVPLPVVSWASRQSASFALRTSIGW